MSRILSLVACFALLPSTSRAAEPLTMIVMDPLALPLSCPCVAGYAQRDYAKLAEHLEAKLGRPVEVHFSDSFAAALEKKSDGKADIIIGKDSVVRSGTEEAGIPAEPVAALTGKDGETTQKGLLLVAAGDPAFTPTDLAGYKIILGPTDSDEKHEAALKLLKDFEVIVPSDPATCTACDEGALEVLELHKSGVKAATVISSYAQPLLEGCGTIRKGDLRVIGETDPVPFVRAYVNTELPTGVQDAIRSALLGVGASEELRDALETKHGFVALEGAKKN
jgi:ABC-type phosphate/phosphonate transport system substrate-binding protein